MVKVVVTVTDLHIGVKIDV